MAGKAKKPAAAKKAVAKKPASKVKAGTSKVSAADRKKLFVEAYITNGGNATQAAISVGFSQASAGVRGSELVKDRQVSREIADRAKAIASKYELTTELAARSIVQELRFDPANLYDAEGNLKAISDLDEDTRMALSSIEFEQHGNTDAPVYVRKVKWAARATAREQLMKHLGMFERDNLQKPAAIIMMEQIAANPASRIKLSK
jgi:phage terminase small subunit